MSSSFIISPWNSPVGLGFITSLAALAAGNAIVFKTSEVSPGSQSIVAEIFKEVCFLRLLIDKVTKLFPRRDFLMVFSTSFILHAKILVLG